MSSPRPVVFTSGMQGTFHPPYGLDGKCSIDVKDAQGRTHILACTLLTDTGTSRSLWSRCFNTEITCKIGEQSIRLLVPDRQLRPVKAQLTSTAVVRPQRLPELQGRSSSLPQPIRDQVMQFLEEDDDRDVACEILSGVTIPEGVDPVVFLTPILEQASLFPATDKLELLSFFAALQQQGRLIPRSPTINILLNKVLPHLSLCPVQRAQLFHLILSGQKPSIPALEELGKTLAHPSGDYSPQKCVAELVADLVVPNATPSFFEHAVAFLLSSPFPVFDLDTFFVEAWKNSTVHQLPQERVFTEAARQAGVEHETLQPPTAPRKPSTLAQALLETVDQIWSKSSERNQACRLLEAIAVPQGTDPVVFLTPILEQVALFPATDKLELLSFFAALHQQGRLIPRSLAIDTLLNQVVPHLSLCPVQRAQLFHLILSGKEPSIPALERLGNALAHPPNPPGTYSRQKCVAGLVAALVVPKATPSFFEHAVAFLLSSPFAVPDLATFFAAAWKNSTVHKLPRERVFTEAARQAGVEHPRLQPPTAPQQTEEPLREPSTLSPALLEKVDHIWSKNSEKNQACRLLSAIAVPQGTDPEAYLSPILDQISSFPTPHSLELIPVFAELHQQRRLKPLSSMIRDLLTQVLPCFAHSDVARGQLLQFILSSSQLALTTPAITYAWDQMLLATSRGSLEELHTYLIQFIGHIVCPGKASLVRSATSFLQIEPPVPDLVMFFQLIGSVKFAPDEDPTPIFSVTAKRAGQKERVS